MVDKVKIHGEVGYSIQDYFTGCEISQLMAIINNCGKKYGKLKISVCFFFPKVRFIDKLTYVFLECICFYLIENGHAVRLKMLVEDSIETSGINSSPLRLLTTGKREDVIKYKDVFRLEVRGFHYRRVINGENKENTNYLGNYAQEIDSFLKPFGIDDVCRDTIANVFSELVGNAIEHSNTECLVDIDIAPGYIKKLENGGFDENYYYGINIAIISFSDVLLGDGIEKYILQNNEISGGRYEKVLETYDRHKQFFDNDYSSVDFCNITTFQNKISGRESIEETGGTGLPKLINSLQQMSDEEKCYVISGDRCVCFKKGLIEYDCDGWIGFNNEKSYFFNRPNEEVCAPCMIFMPGTAYNLNFVMKGERQPE